MIELIRHNYNPKEILKNLIYFTVVLLRLPFSKPYLHTQKKMVKIKLRNKINALKYDINAAQKIYKKINNLHNLSIKLNVDTPEFYKWKSTAALFFGKYPQWKEGRIDYIKKQVSINKKFQKKIGKKILIIEPGSIISTIGQFFNLDAWIKSKILGFQDNEELILPLMPNFKKRIANPCLLDYFKKYINVIEDPDKAKLYYSFTDNSKCLFDEHIPCGDDIVPHTHASGTYIQSMWDSQNKEPLFKITDDHNERGKKILRQMGIKENDWFVTCHVREPFYKDRDDYRDSDISSFFLAFKEIVANGGWVIRMGDKSMSPIPKMNNVIDYATSEHKSDWMDIFLCASSAFMLGTSSGLTAVSYIFGRPIAMTNNLPTATTYLSKRDIFLPRLMQSLEDGRMLNLVELMTKPYNFGCYDGMYRNILKVKPLPNTDIEIQNLTAEMIKRVNDNIGYTEEEEKLQNNFKSLTAAREVMTGLPGFPIQCRIGKEFLKNNKRFLKEID